MLRWYRDGVRGFEGTPGTVIPRYIGNRKHEWRIGETTDDTERTLAVARAIIADRSASHTSIGRELLACRKCIHPGIRSLWEFHQAGDPARAATEHDGCGAAVRAAPIGILHPPSAFDDLVDHAYEASIPTHGGSRAIAAAAATAAAVSAGIEGASQQDVFALAERAAVEAERRWPPSATPAFATALRTVRDSLASLSAIHAGDVAGRCFPSTPLTIVPLAIALATTMDSAEAAILVAANVGGDSDSVASIAGGILGAMSPHSVNPEWCAIVAKVNGVDLPGVASRLTPMRESNGQLDI